MTRVRSDKTRQAILVLDGVFDPSNPPEKLALFDLDGNQLDFSPAHVVPPGGDEGQVLGKTGDADYAIEWIDAGDGSGAVIPSGGFEGQVLGKLSDDNGDVGWVTSAGGSGSFDWQGAWVDGDYDAGAVVRYGKGLYIATAPAESGDIPGTAEIIQDWQDAMGDMPGTLDAPRLHANEEQPWHVSTGGSLDDDWDLFFFDVITAGTVDVVKTPVASYSWMNMYYGSTGTRFASNPGSFNFSDTLGVGRYFVLMTPNGGTTRDGFVEVIPGTAEISAGAVNPWELVIMGSQSYVYDD